MVAARLYLAGQYDGRQAKWITNLLEAVVNTERVTELIHTKRRVISWLMAFDLSLSYCIIQYLVMKILGRHHTGRYLRYDSNSVAIVMLHIT